MSVLLLGALLGSLLLLTHATPSAFMARALTTSAWLLAATVALLDLDVHLPKVLASFLENSIAADLSVVIALGVGAAWIVSRPPAMAAILLTLLAATWIRSRRSPKAR